ncbi:TolB family protein [Kitasatospora sp. NPDC086801]|uniref:TolB family protein n=1 Tax=Kitasatospora sp. NPDC086801 TaxID=3364066 RepID=UPI0037FF1801
MTTARTRRWLARTGSVLVAAAVAAGTALPAAEARPSGETARVSEGLNGAQPDGFSYALGLSLDGRAALFSSSATNLVPNDTNGVTDLFVRNLWTKRIERVSVADDGSQLNAETAEGTISGDGRYVTFSTTATNAVPGQPHHESDVFVRDLWTGHTELVTAGGTTSTDDQTIRNAFSPSLSWDGRYVTYSSDRTDLAPGVHRGKFNIYVTDRWTHTTRLVTTGADGGTADNNSFRPTISADGSTIGFTSRAGNLLPPDQPAATATDAPTGLSDTAEAAEAAAPARPAAGAEPRLTGPRYYPFFVWNAHTGRTSAGSIDETGAFRGTGLDNRISLDGRYAIYSLPVFGGGDAPHRTRLDVYARELATGKLTKVSATPPGTTTTKSSSNGVMTLDDRWVYFDSDADNLVPGDTNQQTDVFRRDLRTGHTELVSRAQDGSQSTGASYGPAIDALGLTTIFTAEDGTLVPGDTNHASDVFLRRR